MICGALSDDSVWLVTRYHVSVGSEGWDIIRDRRLVDSFWSIADPDSRIPIRATRSDE